MFFIIGLILGFYLTRFFYLQKITRLNRYISILETETIKKIPYKKLEDILFAMNNPEWINMQDELEQQFKEEK